MIDESYTSEEYSEVNSVNIELLFCYESMNERTKRNSVTADYLDITDVALALRSDFGGDPKCIEFGGAVEIVCCC